MSNEFSIKRFFKQIDLNELKKIIIYSFVFGIIAHGFCFFNTNFSFDSLCDVYEESPVHMISIGRYIRPLYRLIRGNFTLPTLIGFLSLLFLAISTYFIIESLNIKNKYFKIIICGILVTNYAFSKLNATYIHDSDSYAFAIMLIVIGVYISLKNNKYLFISTILFFLSLGIFQAYINIAIIMYLIDAFLNLSSNENWKSVLKDLFKRFVAIGISMIIYYIGNTLILKIMHIEIASDYHAITNVIDLSKNSIFSRIKKCANSQIRWFINPSNANVNLIVVFNFILLLISLYLIYIHIKKCKSKQNIIFSLIIVIMIPFGINAMTLISNTYHDLTMYSFFFYYIFVLKLIECYENISIVSIIKKITIIIMSIMMFDNIVYSNEIYLKKDLEYDSTLSVFTRIIDRVEQVDGYKPGKTEVAIIGSIDDSVIKLNREGMPYKGTGLWLNYSLGYYETYEKYLNYLLGYNIKLVDEETSKLLSENESIKQMPSFPSKDSIKMVNGILIIKLSS